MVPKELRTLHFTIHCAVRQTGERRGAVLSLTPKLTGGEAVRVERNVRPSTNYKPFGSSALGPLVESILAIVFARAHVSLLSLPWQ